MKAKMLKRTMILVVVAAGVSGCNQSSDTAQPFAQDSSVAVTQEASVANELRDPTNEPERMSPQPDAARRGSTLCNIEYIDDEKFSGEKASASPEVVVRGWVGDEVTRTVPSKPTLRFVNTSATSQRWELPLTVDQERADVVKHVNEAGLAKSGFQQKVVLSSMPKGRYHLYITYRSGDIFHTCDNGRHLTVE